MIRIVGIQRHEDVTKEFILLQNQGSMRVKLRGHTLISDHSMDEPSGAQVAYCIRDDIYIQPGQYILVRTCSGEAKWDFKNEGYVTYCTYLRLSESAWQNSNGIIHILAPQHSLAEKQKATMLI